MVGLRLGTASGLPAGAPLVGGQDGVFPIAAALSSCHLSHYCSACFAPCVNPASIVACQGPCQGAIVYCSSFCCTSDLQLHSDSGECLLLAICALSAHCENACSGPVQLGLDAIFSHDVWQGRTSFPSLGGTCDLRTALRLLAHHVAQHNASRFLTSRKNSENCRLGPLISNRPALLPSRDIPAMQMTNWKSCELPSARGSTEIEDDDAQELARDLREAALLMCFARHLRARLAAVKSGEPMTREYEILLVEEALCQVFTNGVLIVVDKLEQHDSALAESGSYLVTVNLGTAVYGPFFSWFNHSCRPNAFYRFVCGDPQTHENSTPYEFEVKVVPDLDTSDVVDTWRQEFLRTPLPRRVNLVPNQKAPRSLQLQAVMALG